MKSLRRNPRSSLMTAIAGGAVAEVPGATNRPMPGRPARRIASRIQPTSWIAPWVSRGENGRTSRPSMKAGLALVSRSLVGCMA